MTEMPTTSITPYALEKSFAWMVAPTKAEMFEGKTFYRQDYAIDNGESLVITSDYILTGQTAHLNKLIMGVWNTMNNGIMYKEQVESLKPFDFTVAITMEEALVLLGYSEDRTENRQAVIRAILNLNYIRIAYQKIKKNGSRVTGQFTIYNHVKFDEGTDRFSIEITPEYVRQLLDEKNGRYIVLPPKFKGDKTIGLYYLLAARGQGINIKNNTNILNKEIHITDIILAMQLTGQYKANKRRIDNAFAEIARETGIVYEYNRRSSIYTQKNFVSKGGGRPRKVRAKATVEELPTPDEFKNEEVPTPDEFKNEVVEDTETFAEGEPTGGLDVNNNEY